MKKVFILILVFFTFTKVTLAKPIPTFNSGYSYSILDDVPLDTDKGCESYLGPVEPGYPAYYLQFIFNLMKYIAIILLFVLTIVEFGKATVSSNQDAMKKAIQNTVKRFIIAVIIFFLPILIEFLLELLGVYSASTCGIS